MAYGWQRCYGQGEAAIAGDKRDSKRAIVFFVLVAVVGLAVVPALVLSGNMVAAQTSLGRFIVGSLFTALCIAGLTAAIYPAKCRRMFGDSQHPILPNSNGVPIVGHHPDCEKYHPNRIDRRVCAACSGLLVGAIVSLVGAWFYFFAESTSAEGSVLLLLVCEGFMLLGLAQIFFKTYFKALVNMMFVVGSFVAIVQVDVLGKNLTADLYMLTVIGFMLWLRISLSEWHNHQTCQSCRRCF